MGATVDPAVPENDVTILSDIRPEDFPGIWYEYANEDHFWCQWRLAAFLKQLADLGLDTSEPMSGLEIGCGNGLVRRQLEQNTAWSVDGADIDLPVLKRNGTERSETFLYNIHERSETLREKYDFVLLFDVLEHIPDDEADSFLDSSLFHLRPGGWLFINVPAGEYMRSKYDTIAGHFRRYSKPMMQRHFELAGLQTRDIRYWGLSLVQVALLRKYWLATVKDDDAIIRTGFRPPSPFINQSFKTLMKIETSLFRRPFLGTSVLGAAQKG